MRDSQRSIWVGVAILLIMLFAAVVLVLQIAEARRLRRVLQDAEAYRFTVDQLPLQQGGAWQTELTIPEYVPAERMLLVLQGQPGIQLNASDAFAEMTRLQRELGALQGTVRVLNQAGELVQESALGLRHGVADQRSGGVVLAVLPALPKGNYQLQIEIAAPIPDTMPGGSCELLYDIGRLTYLPLYKSYARVLVFTLLAVLLARILITQLLTSHRQRQNEKWLAEGIGCDKIIYLLTAYPLWSETFLRQDLRLLLAEGVPLQPLALFPGDGECQPGWPQVRVLSPSPPAAAGSGAVSFSRYLPAVLRAVLSLLRHRRLLRQLQTEIRASHAWHIHAEFADLGALLASVAARHCGISFSLGIHARDVHARKYPLKMLCQEVSFVTTCNRAAGAALIKQIPGIAPKMHLIYHGLELPDWPFREKEPADAPLLFVGRFMPKKGLPILLQALAQLQEAGERCDLVVVGSGPSEAEFKALSESLGLAGKVQWLGILPREEVAQQLSKAEAICVPSVVARDGDREGIPNVVVEAMASGVPVVAGISGGIAEILTPETGWPLDEVTPAALLAAIRALRSEPEERERRRRLARQRVEKDFDAMRLIQRRKNLFRR
ncbi:MAG: glycosyltransferase family 4 protein [Lentisphaerae bacterium]|nr:glycosyltransferase family 4 protein [Lentisphaerota bacterium]